MKNVITNISKTFIDEAKSSPRMLEDLAAMEKYLSESYDGRTFVELIQNADDANSSRVCVDYVNSVLIVANDGRSFDENDIMAICRSGSSNKQRGENIGYRGVGFKSATTISTEIIIYSSNTFFTFSKSLCARTLNLNEEKVPTVRIPFIYNESELESNVLLKIEELESEGFTTFFIFKGAKINKFKEEVEGFDSGWLLFLNKVSNVRINLPQQNIVCKVHRKKHNDDTIVKIVGEKEQWYITERNGVSIAFRYDADEIIACSFEESVFHCYLPTIDKTGFPFKVNADFSTDPSRKHIIVDEITEASLDKVGELFVSFVIQATKNNEIGLLNVLNLINTHTFLGDLVSRLEKNIDSRFRNNAWVLNKAGKITTAQNITYFPKWLEADERQQIINSFPYIANNTYDELMYGGIVKINNMLTKYGSKEISNDVLLNQIKGPDTSKALGVGISAKIFTYCGRRIINEKDKTDELFVPTQSGYVQLCEISDSAELDNNFIGIVTSVLNNKEKSTLANNYKVFSLFNKNNSSSSGIKPQGVTKPIKKDNLAVNKWKTPIQNCIAVEELEGRTAKDVSRKSDSYEIESVDARGENRYITVKKVKTLGDSFTLSESEYAAAQRLGTAYKVFVISLDGESVDYTYIDDPVNSLEFERQVKEWEFICEKYSTPIKNKNTSSSDMIDQRFLNTLLPEFFNSIQRSFIMDFISSGEIKVTDDMLVIIEKINSIVDFYTGEVFLEISDDIVTADVSKINAMKKVMSN